MRRLFALLILLVPLSSMAQPKQGQARLDSLLAEVPKMKEDTNGVRLLHYLTLGYTEIDPNEGLAFARQELDLARKIGLRKDEASAHNDFGLNYLNMAAYPEALDAFFKAIRI